MSDSNPLLLDKQLCFSLYATSLAMTQVYKPLLEPLGLTYPQYLVLLILWEQDGLGLKDIAARLGQKPGALTPVIKRMEAEGLISRARSSADERLLEIRLSEHGRSLREQALQVNACAASHCNAAIPELMDLKERLDVLRRALQGE
ncbi:MAG: MarR family transcriptional regulator [Saccharospirillaceae bacterium]|nr:MarR family transcriptional regulator [Saccharospirillaceae bacterium]MCD8532431.1 MarR family transcriptional regulator [Saccharospirillaceae bacterium]